MIEFAMIAPPFFLLLLGMIEMGVIYFASSTLQYAVDDMARKIRTGQVQAIGMTQAQFRGDPSNPTAGTICGDIQPLLACDAKLQIDVESYPDYTTASFPSPTDASGNVNPKLDNFEPGTACNVVLLRAFYTWPVVTPMLQVFLANMNGGNRLISAAAAFRNEPFTAAVAGC